MKQDRISAIGRYVLAVLLMAALSIRTGSGWMSGMLVFLLLVPPASLAANWYVRKHIQARILLPTTAAKQALCTGSLVLENRSRLPVSKLYCTLGLTNDLTREEATLDLICSIDSGSESTTNFQMENAYCGRVYLHLGSARILDYFGLFSLKVPVTASARMTVLPELFSCDVTTTPVSSAFNDSTAPRRGDDRTEIFQLREYQSGDDIRQIHWKLSSKLDNLLLKEPSLSVSRSLLVFWDKRNPCTPQAMDAMAEVTASVCQALSDSGVAFDLCWTEKEELELRQIRDGETLLQSIPALVTQCGTPDCPNPDGTGYGQILYITSEPSGLVSGRNTTCLLCSQDAPEDERCIVFSPENYSQRLERLEF